MIENQNISKSQALRKVMQICSKQEKSQSEIIKKLKNWNLNQDDIIEIIDILVKEKFIDENRYLNSFINDKLLFNKWGKIKISYQLKMKGIESKKISVALNCIEEEKYLNLLKSEIQKRFKIKNQKPDNFLNQRIIKSFLQRGFEFDVIKKAIHELINE